MTENQISKPKNLGQFQKGAPGRPKGVPNKVNAQARENIMAVFTRLGGTAAMAEWARENQTQFYKLYARLIPVDTTVSNPDGTPVSFTITFK